MTITYDHKKVKGGLPQSPLFADRITIAYAAETYSTGGLAVDWTDSGLDGQFTGKSSNIVAVVDLGGSGYTAQYDYTNDKLLVYYGDYSESADGPHAQYPDSTALTATFTLLVITS